MSKLPRVPSWAISQHEIICIFLFCKADATLVSLAANLERSKSYISGHDQFSLTGPQAQTPRKRSFFQAFAIRARHNATCSALVSLSTFARLHSLFVESRPLDRHASPCKKKPNHADAILAGSWQSFDAAPAQPVCGKVCAGSHFSGSSKASKM